MSLYNYPTNLTEIFNDINYVTAKDEALSENEADDLYISRDGNELVNVRIQFKNQQIFGNGITLYKNISLKDSNDVTQLIINNLGLNDMSINDISNCSFTSGNLQTQINTNIFEIGNNLTKINKNIADIILVDNKTIANLEKININTSLITTNTQSIANFNSTISSINSSIAAYTLVSNNNTTKINTNIADLTNINLNFATKTDLTNAINNLIGGAGVTMDTLYELSQLLIDTQSLQDVIDAITNHTVNTTLTGITNTENIVFSGTLNNILISELNTLDNMDENIKSKMNSIDSINTLLIAEDILLNSKITTNINNISTNITNITNLTTGKADLTLLTSEILRLNGYIDTNILNVSNLDTKNTTLTTLTTSMNDTINLKSSIIYSDSINDKVTINTNKLQYMTFGSDTTLKFSTICNNNALNYVHAFNVEPTVTIGYSTNLNLFTNFFREKLLTVNANVILENYANTYIRQSYNVNILGTVKNACSLRVESSTIGSITNYSVYAGGLSFMDALYCDIITGTTITNINDNINLKSDISYTDAQNLILQNQITNNNNKLNSISETNNSVNITPIFDNTYTNTWLIPFKLEQQMTVLSSSNIEYIFASMFRPSVINILSNNIIKNYYTLMIQQPSDPSKITIAANSRVLEACNLRLYSTSFAENNFALVATGSSKIETIECDDVYTHKGSIFKDIRTYSSNTLQVYLKVIDFETFTLNTNISFVIETALQNSTNSIWEVEGANYTIYFKLENSETLAIIEESSIYYNTGSMVDIPANSNVILENINKTVNNISVGKYSVYYKIVVSGLFSSAINQLGNLNNLNSMTVDEYIAPTNNSLTNSYLNVNELNANNIKINNTLTSNSLITDDFYLNNKIYTNNIYTPIIRCMMTFIYDSNGFISLNDNDTLLFSYSSSGRYNLTFQNVVPPNTYYNVVCNGTKSGDETYANNLTYLSFSKLTTSFYIKQFSGSSPENHNAGGWSNITVSW